MSDNRNVIDKYKGWMEDLIREDLKTRSYPYAVLVTQLNGDFNMGSIVRSANFFGAQEVFYYGRRKWDRRSALGTYHYTNVNHLETIDQLRNLKEKYTFVALENNINRNPIQLKDYVWKKNSVILIGEEGMGLSDEILDLCDSIVEIKGFGSVRSLNAAVAGSIAMYDYISKYNHE